MRVQRLWKRTERLFHPGVLSTVVIGTALFLLLTLFVAATPVPTTTGPTFGSADLPENPRGYPVKPARAKIVHLSPGGETWIDGFLVRDEDAFRGAGPYELHVHRDTPWIVLRDLLRQLSRREVRIAVRNPDGSVSRIEVSPEIEPELDVNAKAQEYVDLLK